jgi:hypothetical protein
MRNQYVIWSSMIFIKFYDICTMVTLSLQIKLNIGNTEQKRLQLSTCHVEPDLSLFPKALNDPSFLMYVSCLWYPETT